MPTLVVGEQAAICSDGVDAEQLQHPHGGPTGQRAVGVADAPSAAGR
ncbi:hypothetical protein [Mycolicibacterium tusciae]|nr:hypothetical protein [Mycolicibacterium tusciae]